MAPAKRQDLAVARHARPEEERVVSLVLDRLTSPHSKRVYRAALARFLDWYQETRAQRLDRATVQAYRTLLVESELAPSSVNQALSAIRALAQEACDNGLVDQDTTAAIQRVKGVKTAGVRTGNWLPKEQAQDLLDAPSTRSIIGLRDRAVLALLLGCGLRRAEAAALRFEHVQLRDNRWAIVDIRGKGQRVRTVPMPAWCKTALDEWARAVGIASGHVLRPLTKSHKLARRPRLSEQAIADVVAAYAGGISQESSLAPHDLRRTFAKLALRGGSPLDQISLNLGHASLETTQKYLGLDLNLSDAPADHLGLTLHRR